jgi:hypothetical protein
MIMTFIFFSIFVNVCMCVCMVPNSKEKEFITNVIINCFLFYYYCIADDVKNINLWC